MKARSLLALVIPVFLSACGDASDETPVPGDDDASAEDTPKPDTSVVLIHEIVAQDLYDGPDWIELFNPGTAPVTLDGWTLTDSTKEGNPDPDHLFVMPTGTTIQAGGYLVFKAGEPDSFDFGLGSSDGVFLSDASGKSRDSTSWSARQAAGGRSWGRTPGDSSLFATLGSPTPGAANDAPYSEHVGASDYIFDGSRVDTFELEVAPDDLEYMTVHAQEELYVPGVIKYEGYSYGPVGVRYKGNSSLAWCFDSEGNQLCPKVSLKVDFQQYNDGVFYGMNKLQFAAMSRDYSQLRERVSYEIVRDEGLLAPRAVHSEVWLNGEKVGLFLLTEQVDAAFFQYRFPGENVGNLYKAVWPNSLDPQVYADALENHQSSADVGQMVDFASAMLSADDESFLSSLGDFVDVSTFIRFLAVDRQLGNFDGFLSWTCGEGQTAPCANDNYYWYEHPSGKLELVVWDLEATFASSYDWQSLFGIAEWYQEAPCEPVPYYYYEGMYGLPASCDPLLGKLARNGWDQYVAAAQSFQEESFQEAEIAARIDAVAEQIAPYVEGDPNLSFDVSEWPTWVQMVKDDIPLLRSEITAQTSAP